MEELIQLNLTYKEFDALTIAFSLAASLMAVDAKMITNTTSILYKFYDTFTPKEVDTLLSKFEKLQAAMPPFPRDAPNSSL
jgi:hypothetical protein